jgi:hypothetical protein
VSGDAGDASRRLGELIALAAGDLAPLREAIDVLERKDADAALLAAVLRIASLEAAVSFDAAEAEHDPDDSSRAEDDEEELPVADPWADPDRPFAAALDSARQLRRALIEQDDLSGLLAALSAISNAEAVTIVFELGLEALWERRLGAGN